MIPTKKKDARTPGIRTCSRLERLREAAPETVVRVPRLVERTHALRRYRVVPARPPVAHRGSGSEPRRREPLALQALERHVHGTGRHVALEPVLDILQHGAAIRLLAQPDNGEEDRLFERPEHVSQ